VTSVDVGSLAEDKTSELMSRPAVDGWAACASVWARLFVLATPGWAKWPELHAVVSSALSLALARSTGLALPAADVVAQLGELEVEDDGSPEWQYVIDIVVMLQTALYDDDLENAVRTTVLTYLEETFTLLSNDLASRAGRPISLTDAEARLAEDERWRRAVDFVRSL
jgi:hypothetical protein